MERDRHSRAGLDGIGRADEGRQGASSAAVGRGAGDHREDGGGAADGDFVFPGGKAGRPLSNMALLMLLRRMGRGDLTAHGFRSTFRDWAGETTDFPREVIEMALAHTLGDKVEAAYRRSDGFQKRLLLAEAWAAPAGRKNGTEIGDEVVISAHALGLRPELSGRLTGTQGRSCAAKRTATIRTMSPGAAAFSQAAALRSNPGSHYEL